MSITTRSTCQAQAPGAGLAVYCVLHMYLFFCVLNSHPQDKLTGPECAKCWPLELNPANVHKVINGFYQ